MINLDYDCTGILIVVPRMRMKCDRTEFDCFWFQVAEDALENISVTLQLLYRVYYTVC